MLLCAVRRRAAVACVKPALFMPLSLSLSILSVIKSRSSSFRFLHTLYVLVLQQREKSGMCVKRPQMR